jgi:outer membrane receptor protein involved in Fe transport
VKSFTKDSKLEAGYKGIVRQSDGYFLADTLNNNINQYVENYDVSNEFKYTEQIYALYAQYGSTFGNFSFKAGLRGEQTYTKGTLINNDSIFTTKYFALFPTLSATQKLSDWEQIQASYSRRINRPNNFRINPFINRSDPLNITYGNPNLKPEYTDSYELNFVTTFGNTSITPSFFLRRTSDMMTRYLISVHGDTTSSTFTNLNSSTSYGLDLIASSQIFKFWNLNATLSFYNLTYEGGNIDNFSAPSGFSFKANASTGLTLPKLFNLQLFYNYFGKQYTSQGTVKAYQSMDIGVSKQFFDNSLTVLLKANDIFKTIDDDYIINGLGYTQNYTSTSNTRGVVLTLTYNFGQHDNQKGKKKSNNNNPNDMMDEGN